MKKFAGNKPLAVIKQQCCSEGVDWNDLAFRGGSDYVTLSGGGATVVYNTFNGEFFGTTPRGVGFDSSSTKHEGESWFQALLSFFYVEKKAALAPKASALDWAKAGRAREPSIPVSALRAGRRREV